MEDAPFPIRADICPTNCPGAVGRLAVQGMDLPRIVSIADDARRAAGLPHDMCPAGPVVSQYTKGATYCGLRQETQCGVNTIELSLNNRNVKLPMWWRLGRLIAKVLPQYTSLP